MYEAVYERVEHDFNEMVHAITLAAAKNVRDEMVKRHPYLKEEPPIPIDFELDESDLPRACEFIDSVVATRMGKLAPHIEG